MMFYKRLAIALVASAVLTIGCGPRDPGYKSKPIDTSDRTKSQLRYQQERQGGGAGRS